MNKRQKFAIIFTALAISGCSMKNGDINDIDSPSDIPFSESLQHQLGYTQSVIHEIKNCHIQHSENTEDAQTEKNKCACRVLKGRVPKVYAKYCQEGDGILSSANMR